MSTNGSTKDTEQASQEPVREEQQPQPQPEERPIEAVMAIVAHPDDAEFSSAGTLAKFAREGKRTYIVVCTSGNKGTPDPEMTGEKLAAMRREEQLGASKELGITETIFLDNPDGELFPTLEFREQIVRQLRKYRPDVVLTHDPFRPYSLHPDHRAVGITTTDAIYPTARDAIYFPEHYKSGLQPWKVGEIWYYGAEHPDKFIDISETFDQKIAALKHHESQVGRSQNLAERLRERAHEVGKEAGLELAEAFKVVRLRR
ncbi:MAG TPA: PIG-L deacetylase family protein [Thermomicrobiales bacterium]|nr:PIG-L deacetylase family protein [Thermomicrobiales bacterium]